MCFKLCFLDLNFNPIGVPQRENQVAKLMPLKPCNKLFVLPMRNFTGIVFEDGLRCFARRSVKKHDRCHLFPKRFSNAGYLLGQDPHADAVMACHLSRD